MPIESNALREQAQELNRRYVDLARRMVLSGQGEAARLFLGVSPRLASALESADDDVATAISDLLLVRGDLNLPDRATIRRERHIPRATPARLLSAIRAAQRSGRAHG